MATHTARRQYHILLDHNLLKLPVEIPIEILMEQAKEMVLSFSQDVIVTIVDDQPTCLVKPETPNDQPFWLDEKLDFIQIPVNEDASHLKSYAA